MLSFQIIKIITVIEQSFKTIESKVVVLKQLTLL